MKTVSVSKIIGAASVALLLAVVIPATALGQYFHATINNIRCDVSTRSEPGAATHIEVAFSGFPRAGDYVTRYYNVRGTGIQGHADQEQFEFSSNQWLVVRGGARISVQACRKLEFRASKCTRWVTFNIAANGQITGGP